MSNIIVRHRYLIVTLIMSAFVLGFTFSILVGTATADNTDPLDIVDTVDPSDATDSQIEAVESWLYSQDELDDETQSRVGQWLTDARQSSDNSNTSDIEDVAEEVVVEVNDNISVNSAVFDDEAETVELTMSASERSEEVVLTDPGSVDETGAGDVRETGVTVPRGEVITVEFDVEYSIAGNATVWVSAGAGETVYISNPTEPLIDRLQWVMIPVAVTAGALAVLLSGLVYIYRQYRKLSSDYTNVFRDI